METLKRPQSFNISYHKKFSNLKLSNHNSIIKKNLKINPLSPTLKNSPINIFSPIKDKAKNIMSLNKTHKNIKSSNSNKNIFGNSKKYYIQAVDSINKEKGKVNEKLKFNNSPILNKKSPIYLKKNEKNFVKYIKNYPKTFYQKIANNIQKMKIHTNKTLNAMRKNLKISDKEVFHRTTSVINIHNIKNRKKKQYNFYNNYEEFTNLDYSLLAKKPKNSKSFQIIPFSDSPYVNTTKIKTSSSYKNDENFSFKKKKINLLGLSKIPSTSFIKIKDKPFYVPLFKHLENNKNFYKNMYHIRSFEMNDKIIQKSSRKIYDMPSALLGLSSYEKEPEIQLKYLFNKIKLIQDNIKHFKSNYMIKRDFRLAFINMENPVKAEFNYILEELCALLIRIIPQLLKTFYNSLDQLLFINIPGIDDEMQKNCTNEIECLKLNISFFNKVTDYFSACVDIFNVIQKQIAEFKYTSSEFQPLNINLDLARFDTSRLISMAESYIEKTKNDENVFSKLELGLNIKRKKRRKKDELDILERFHKRRRIKINLEAIKLDRINSALNIAANGMKKDIMVEDEKRKKINLNKGPSILNSPLIKDMMKYFLKNIKATIISQQVIERFKTKELKRLRTFDNNNNDNDSKNYMNG